MHDRPAIASVWLTLVLVTSCDSAPQTAWKLAVAPQSPAQALAKVNALAIADFGADGQPDLAVINGDPGELLMLQNRGQGRFDASASGGRMTIGATASGIVAADLNKDARPDLVICFHDRDEVAVLIGKGGDQFEPPSMQTVVKRSQGNPHVHNLAIADINGDGHLDVIVAQAEDNAIAWAHGDGTGAFRPSERTLPAGRHPYTITIADLNGDGRPDCAAPSAESHDLTIGLNDGSGGFAASGLARPRLPERTLALAAGDIDGDGDVDIVSDSDENQRELSVLLGDGRGGFAPSSFSFAAPARCYGQVVADINADGMLDVIAPCIDRSSVLVWLAENPAALQYRQVEFETPGTDSQVLAVGDVNGDGLPDMVTAGWAKPTITVLTGSRIDER